MLIEQNANLYIHMIYGGMLGGLWVLGVVLYKRERQARKLLLDLVSEQHD
ncbi:MAG: hypothetical protein ACTHJ4_07160 [Candidatus Nucleicultricaceae bacterium]